MLAYSVLSKLNDLKDWFIALGPLGAFLIALVDSFIPLPGGSDFAVIGLSSQTPSLAPIVVLAATSGSVIGSTVVYLGARRAGAAALARVSPERRERVENLVGRYDLLALGIPAMLPPPFPFKVFNLTSGVLKIRVERFVFAVTAGRIIRFTTEAVLAIKFGDDAVTIVKQHGLVILGVFVVLGLSFWAWRSFAARRESAVEE